MLVDVDSSARQSQFQFPKEEKSTKGECAKKVTSKGRDFYEYCPYEGMESRARKFRPPGSLGSGANDPVQPTIILKRFVTCFPRTLHWTLHGRRRPDLDRGDELLIRLSHPYFAFIFTISRLLRPTSLPTSGKTWSKLRPRIPDHVPNTKHQTPGRYISITPLSC